MADESLKGSFTWNPKEPSSSRRSSKARFRALGGSVAAFVHSEYSEFSDPVKFIIRWIALIVALSFGFNHGTQQLRSTVCQWMPTSVVFCDEPQTRIGPEKTEQVAASGQLLSKTMQLIMTIVIVLLAPMVVLGAIWANKNDWKGGCILFVGMLLFLAVWVYSAIVIVTEIF